MVARNRTKIVYILPLYDPATGSHFLHLYELLIRASDQLDILLVIERSCAIPREFPFPCYVQRFRFAPLRFAELLFVLIRARISGRLFFYSHYTLFGAVASWAVAALFGGKAYYWNAGLPWLYERRRIEESVFRFVLGRTILVTGTSGLRDQYVRHYGLDPQRTRIMPNWINLARFGSAMDRHQARQALGVHPGAKVVLFVHRLSQRKGADLLPDIAERVLAQEKHAMFLIVGEGPESDSLKFRVQSLKLEPQVRLVGQVPHREVKNYFAAADVFLMPSEEEGFPHVLLEAMASGLPYVASDVGGVREMTPDAFPSAVLEGRDPDACAERILVILRAPAEALRTCSSIEQEWVRRYDLTVVGPVFVSLFS